MNCFCVEYLVCFVNVLKLFILSEANEYVKDNALDYNKSVLHPVAISYDWVRRNTETPGNQMRFMLARVLLTAENGSCIYDKFVKPYSRVIDYRTYCTGITEDILNNAEDFSTVQSDVRKLISDKIVVGYCVYRLLNYLNLEYPIWNQRDAALYPGFQKQNKLESLKTLAYKLLKITIKDGINSPVESAQALMKLYLTNKKNWDMHMIEKYISLNSPVAIDCEMVAKAGRLRNNDMLARVSLVNINGDCIYDKYVLPTHKVTDYRTHISGVDEGKLSKGVPLDIVRREVSKLTEGKVLVGHDLYKDTFLLHLRHPTFMIRDTSLFRWFRTSRGRPKLRDLAASYLGMTIQSGAHCSIEDAKACMELYTMYKTEWDREIFVTEQKYVNERDLTNSNPEYESSTIAIVCSLQPGMKKAARLHRVSIVDSHLVCIYDKFVSESEEENCETYNVVRHEVAKMLKGKIIVGFDLRSTFAVLQTTSNFVSRRDALLFKKFTTSVENVTLIELFNKFLDKCMPEEATLNSVDEAKMLMMLYLKHKTEWDEYVEKEYIKQIEATYNSILENPIAISSQIFKLSNMSVLGRISIVDFNDNCMYDKYLKPANLESIGPLIDSVTYEKLKNGHPYEEVKKEIQEIINSKVVIGHYLPRTFQLLGLYKQWWYFRDASRFNLFQEFKQFPQSLNEILKLGLNIELKSDNDTVECAKALMQLYKKFEAQWNDEIKKKQVANKLNVNDMYLGGNESSKTNQK